MTSQVQPLKEIDFLQLKRAKRLNKLTLIPEQGRASVPYDDEITNHQNSSTSEDLDLAGSVDTHKLGQPHKQQFSQLRAQLLSSSYISADEFREADIMRSVFEFFRCSLPKAEELCFLSELSRRAARYMANDMPADASLCFILHSRESRDSPAN